MLSLSLMDGCKNNYAIKWWWKSVSWCINKKCEKNNYLARCVSISFNSISKLSKIKNWKCLNSQYSTNTFEKKQKNHLHFIEKKCDKVKKSPKCTKQITVCYTIFVFARYFDLTTSAKKHFLRLMINPNRLRWYEVF